MIDEDQILESLPREINIRRRKLLPLWIIVFCWIFMITGGLSVLSLVAGLFGMSFHLSLYGIDTYDPLSLPGLVVLFLFLLKGLVAFGLWMEKSWAVRAGMIDGLIGFIICLALMFIQSIASGFRIEILIIIPYMNKLRKIKSQWEEIKQ